MAQQRAPRRRGGEDAEAARDVGAAAVERGRDVTRGAAQHARGMATTAREQALVVAEEVSQRTRSLLGETKTRIDTQAQAGVEQLSGNFRQLGGEAQALVEGRPEDAPTLRGYVSRAADALEVTADRLDEIAETVETEGLTGLLDELQSIARRRPGLFLVGAAVAGLGVGRLIRAGGDDQDEPVAQARGGARAALPSRTGAEGTSRARR